MRKWCFHYSGVMCLMIVVAIGCGKSDPLNRQPVSGTVSLGGEPVVTGVIEFSPVAAGGMSSGASITEGHYTIPAEKGLPPGEYLVRISSAGEESAAPDVAGEATLKKELIPLEYNVNSKETRTVSADQQNVFDFEIPALK